MFTLQAATILVLMTVVLHASAKSPGPGISETKKTVNIGVQIIYDTEFNELFIRAQRFYQLTKKGPDDYFAASLAGAELRFREVEGFKIKLTLLSAYNLQNIGVPAGPAYYKTLNGTKTIESLLSLLKNDHARYEAADIILFVTGNEVLRSVTDNNVWHGVAETGQVCGNKVGVVSDDGKSFTGVDQMAIQIALLLNASRDHIDNECNTSDHFLLSGIYGGLKSKFSPCSYRDIASFLKKGTPDCLTDEVRDAYNAQLPAVYHNTTGYDLCNVYHSHNRDVMTCKPGDEEPRRNVTCGVHCCDYEYRHIPYKPFLYVHVAADGTSCGEGKICVGWECEEKEGENSSME